METIRDERSLKCLTLFLNANEVSLNNIANKLGTTVCKAIGLFHAFTGCDSTSSFKFKGKRYYFKTFQNLPEVISEFANPTNSFFWQQTG